MKRCIALIGVAAIFVLNAAAQEWPRYETSLNYTFTRFGSSINAPAFNANGGNGQFAYNFNRWFSGVVDLGAVHNANFTDATVTNYLGGPRITVRKSRLAPYFQVLFGGVYATQSLAAPIDAVALEAGIVSPVGTTIRATRQQTGFAMAAGGGLDVKLSRHVSLRALEVEYFLTRLNDFRAINDKTQDNIRASAGITFMFGGEEPAPPHVQPTKTCPDGSVIPADQPCPKRNISLSLSATPREICQGETAQLNASISGAGGSQLSFDWFVNNQEVGEGHSFMFDSKERQAGTYTIAVKVSGADINPASAQTTVTVRPYIAPTATAKAEPAEILVGEKSTLSATCQGQCGGNMQPPTFTASDGTVNGDQFDSTSVQFDPSDSSEQRKTITITATCADSRNKGTATTTVTVIKKATIAAVRLPDVLFDANSPRVNNCGKRVLLEQLKAYFDRDSAGTAVLVGHQSSDEKAADLSNQRIMNAAAVITAGTGVCLAIPQNQVLVSAPGVDQNGVSYEAGFCRSSVKGASDVVEKRRVEVWFVPTGGEKPASLTQAQSASSLSLSGIGCPK